MNNYKKAFQVMVLLFVIGYALIPAVKVYAHSTGLHVEPKGQRANSHLLLDKKINPDNGDGDINIDNNTACSNDNNMPVLSYYLDGDTPEDIAYGDYLDD